MKTFPFGATVLKAKPAAAMMAPAIQTHLLPNLLVMPPTTGPEIIK